eukprot:scaffold630_cov350-Pavlova_lutheri.AAC.9
MECTPIEAHRFYDSSVKQLPGPSLDRKNRVQMLLSQPVCFSKAVVQHAAILTVCACLKGILVTSHFGAKLPVAPCRDFFSLSDVPTHGF